MPSDFDRPYDPKAVEPEIYAKWEKSGFFDPDKLPGKRTRTFTIAIPPPNVTGSLHMGHDLGREEFLKRVWAWKEKYGDIILDQLKKLGASCDWSRTRFTMDAEYVKAVE